MQLSVQNHAILPPQKLGICCIELSTFQPRGRERLAAQ